MALRRQTGMITGVVYRKNVLWGLTCDGHWETAGSSTNSEEGEIRRKGMSRS